MIPNELGEERELNDSVVNVLSESEITFISYLSAVIKWRRRAYLIGDYTDRYIRSDSPWYDGLVGSTRTRDIGD